MGLKWFKGQFWSKNNMRTIESRVTWAYTRVGLYAAVFHTTTQCNKSFSEIILKRIHIPNL